MRTGEWTPWLASPVCDRTGLGTFDASTDYFLIARTNLVHRRAVREPQLMAHLLRSLPCVQRVVEFKDGDEAAELPPLPRQPASAVERRLIQRVRKSTFSFSEPANLSLSDKSAWLQHFLGSGSPFVSPAGLERKDFEAGRRLGRKNLWMPKNSKIVRK